MGMKVVAYAINRGTPAEYYGLMVAEDRQVLHGAPNKWKSERGALAWAKKHGYEIGGELRCGAYSHDNWDYPKDEHGHTSVLRRVHTGTDHYSFEVVSGTNSLITVEKNGISKTVYVEDCDSRYVYNCGKDRIIAQDGAAGLFDFLEKETREGALFECNARRILDYIVDEMKAV